jgi:hypothetical protein
MRKTFCCALNVLWPVAAILVLCALFVYVFVVPHPRAGAGDFRRNRARYEAIVAKLKTMPRPHSGRAYYVDRDLDPASIAEKDVAYTMTGRVSLMRTDSGSVQVDIVTDDSGHLGSYGYIYTDGSKPDGGPEAKLQKIDAHWWSYVHSD